MLNTANIATIKNLAKAMTGRLGVDYLDSNFSLFSENDQEAEMFLTLLKTAVEEVAQNLFDKKIALEQKYLTLSVDRSPEVDRKGNDIWTYSFLHKNIFRVHGVWGNNQPLYRVNSIEELANNNYTVNLFKFKTTVRYNAISLLIAPNTFYAINVDNEFTLQATPQGDEDYCILDKELVINKLGYVYGIQRGLNQEAMACAERYQNRLTYIIEEGFENTHAMRVC